MRRGRLFPRRGDRRARAAIAAVIWRGPAMLAPIVDAGGTFRGLHCTWLDLEQPKGKAIVVDPDDSGETLPSKKVRGSKAGNVIRLVELDAASPATLYMGEGIETVLSVWCALRLDGRDLCARDFQIVRRPRQSRRQISRERAASDIEGCGRPRAACARTGARHERARHCSFRPTSRGSCCSAMATPIRTRRAWRWLARRRATRDPTWRSLAHSRRPAETLTTSCGSTPSRKSLRSLTRPRRSRRRRYRARSASRKVRAARRAPIGLSPRLQQPKRFRRARHPPPTRRARRRTDRRWCAWRRGRADRRLELGRSLCGRRCARGGARRRGNVVDFPRSSKTGASTENAPAAAPKRRPSPRKAVRRRMVRAI